jgi:hypothetical protein
MAACPDCGRPLATGARRCVYCAHGTSFQRRDELKVPPGTLPKRGAPWKKIVLGLLVLAAIGAYLQPAVREKVDGVVRSLLSRF